MAPYVRRAVGLLLVSLGVFGAGSPPAAVAAEFEIVPGSFAVTALDAGGQPEERAGAHPDLLRTEFALQAEGTSASELEFDMPPGFAGSRDAVPLCSRQLVAEEKECPVEAQVGEVALFFSGSVEERLPIFALEPLPGQLLAFGSKPSLKVSFTAQLRPQDLGVTFRVTDLPEEPIAAGEVELWGVPADHQVGTAIPRRPLLTLPAQCGPMVFSMRAHPREAGAPWVSADSASLPLRDCESLGFAPGFGMRLSAPVTDSPTGLQMELTTPGEDGPDGRREAPIEAVTIAMPDGIAISPAGAAGLVACSDAQLGFGSDAPPQCPPAARVGAVEIESAALGGISAGTIFLGEEHRGERFRIFVVAPGAGNTLKLTGALITDPVTGRLSTALRGLPQTPIARMRIEFEGGPSALLATPLACGPAVAQAEFAPYGDGSPVTRAAAVSIASRVPGLACPARIPFAPRLELDSSTARAGRPNAISATVSREDGEQLPRRFSIALPVGLGAALGSIEPCPEVAAASGACPPASRSGSVVARVGSGIDPATLRGSVYLTGPYRRAPFGLVMAFPATIGPFRLGAMVVRAALPVDGATGRVSVVSDPLPAMVEGVPIRFRSIELALDRPGLIRNPTSCGDRSADGSLESQAGDSAVVASAFVVKGCRRLGFRPRIAMDLDARRGAERAQLRVSARFPRGDSSLRRMQLTLPPDLKLRTSGLGAICSRFDAAIGACPGGSAVGAAIARSPLFDERLIGSVYVVQPPDSGQPDLGVSLTAAGVRLSLTGHVSSRHGRLVTDLAGLPDMPLSSLSLVLGDRKSELLSLKRDPCADGAPRRIAARARLVAQNGARRVLSAPIRTRAGCER